MAWSVGEAEFCFLRGPFARERFAVALPDGERGWPVLRDAELCVQQESRAHQRPAAMLRNPFPLTRAAPFLEIPHSRCLAWCPGRDRLRGRELVARREVSASLGSPDDCWACGRRRSGTAHLRTAAAGHARTRPGAALAVRSSAAGCSPAGPSSRIHPPRRIRGRFTGMTAQVTLDGRFEAIDQGPEQGSVGRAELAGAGLFEL